eukprot:768758-Hanusia_phi.AAC.4
MHAGYSSCSSPASSPSPTFAQPSFQPSIPSHTSLPPCFDQENCGNLFLMASWGSPSERLSRSVCKTGLNRQESEAEWFMRAISDIQTVDESILPEDTNCLSPASDHSEPSESPSSNSAEEEDVPNDTCLKDLPRNRSSMLSNSSSHTKLTLAKKLEIIEYYQKYACTQAHISTVFGKSTSAISKLLQPENIKRLKLLAEAGVTSNMKRCSAIHHPDLEGRVHEYVKTLEKNDPHCISKLCEFALLTAKELNIQKFNPNRRWCHRFLKRHGFSLSKIRCAQCQNITHAAGRLCDTRAPRPGHRCTLFPVTEFKSRPFAAVPHTGLQVRSEPESEEQVTQFTVSDRTVAVRSAVSGGTLAKLKAHPFQPHMSPPAAFRLQVPHLQTVNSGGHGGYEGGCGHQDPPLTDWRRGGFSKS